MNYMDKIVQLRKARGKTQADIAKLLNTTTQYYQKYEKGKHPLPIEHLIKICKYFDVSADELLGLKNMQVLTKSEHDQLIAIMKFNEEPAKGTIDKKITSTVKIGKIRKKSTKIQE